MHVAPVVSSGARTSGTRKEGFRPGLLIAFFALSYAISWAWENFKIVMLPIFVIGLMSAAIVWTWIYNRTGSILAVAVWHGVYNLTGATAAANDRGGLIGAAMWTFVVANAVVLLVFDRRARKAGRPSILGVTPTSGMA